MKKATRVRILSAALLSLGALVTIGIVGWPGTALGEGSDCEVVRSGILAQPVGAWTSLAFVPVGVWAAGYRAVRLPHAVLFGTAFVAVGLASFAGHAAATDWARDLDSLAIKAMLALFVAYPVLRRAEPPRRAVGWIASAIAVIWAIELAVPATARPLLVVLAAAAIIVTLASGDRPTVTAGMTLLGAGALLWWLGRSDGPFCHPEGALQMHGMWHILAAVGFLTIYRGLK